MTRLCYCCNKPIESGIWHKSCIQKFFGTTEIPSINVDIQKLKEIASESVSEGKTVTGVQKKLSLGLYSQKATSPRLTISNYPAGFILKPQSDSISQLPESEHIVMSMAEAAGIKTVMHGLIPISDGTLAFITKRIDRDGPKKIPMEDFCQLSCFLTEDKYKGSYEKCGKVIKEYSSQPGLDLSEFFLLILFCFVTANSDMHLKNFSLINNGSWKLSQAYDLLPVQLVYPSDTEQTALTLNGKKSNLKAHDFMSLARSLDINSHAAEEMISFIANSSNIFIQIADSSLLADELKTRFKALIEQRCKTLDDLAFKNT